MPCYTCGVSWQKNDRPIGFSFLDMKTREHEFFSVTFVTKSIV